MALSQVDDVFNQSNKQTDEKSTIYYLVSVFIGSFSIALGIISTRLLIGMLKLKNNISTLYGAGSAPILTK